MRRRFGVEYTLAGLDLLLHRIGWSVQVPARKATERDEDRIGASKDEQWPVIQRPASFHPLESSFLSNQLRLTTGELELATKIAQGLRRVWRHSAMADIRPTRSVDPARTQLRDWPGGSGVLVSAGLAAR
ncbi:winged helix-turn-helix domain-containing protein [Streptomyces sp. NBC_01320]|nr:winged helix-turn-helix domain-containing protein [Streptomyces sp. NBC_01320]WSK00924.1 winged helix-turn-helix domain-containing protein [Streptomyces sp. NBC_01320]